MSMSVGMARVQIVEATRRLSDMTPCNKPGCPKERDYDLAMPWKEGSICPVCHEIREILVASLCLHCDSC